MSVEDLQALGRQAAGQLLVVMPLVRGDHKQKNSELFEALQAQAPTLQHKSWGDLSWTAGIYASFMGRLESTTEQRAALLNALGWAVRYEIQMRPKMARQRVRQTVGFLRDGMRYPETREAAGLVLTPLVSSLDRSTLEALQSEIASLELSDVNSKISGLLAQLPAAPAPSPEVEESGLAGIIKKLWNYLDRKHEAQNRLDLDRFRAEPESQPGRTALARLGGIVLRSLVQRYIRGTGDEFDAHLVSRSVLRPTWLTTVTGISKGEPLSMPSSSGLFVIPNAHVLIERGSSRNSTAPHMRMARAGISWLRASPCHWPNWHPTNRPRTRLLTGSAFSSPDGFSWTAPASGTS